MAKKPKSEQSASEMRLYRITNKTAVHVAIEDGKEVVYHGTDRLDLKGRTSIRLTPADAGKYTNLGLEPVRDRIEVQDDGDGDGDEDQGGSAGTDTPTK